MFLTTPELLPKNSSLQLKILTMLQRTILIMAQITAVQTTAVQTMVETMVVQTTNLRTIAHQKILMTMMRTMTLQDHEETIVVVEEATGGEIFLVVLLSVVDLILLALCPTLAASTAQSSS